MQLPETKTVDNRLLSASFLDFATVVFVDLVEESVHVWFSKLICGLDFVVEYCFDRWNGFWVIIAEGYVKLHFVEVRVGEQQGISNVRATMPQPRPGTVQVGEVEREEVLDEEVLDGVEEVEIEGAKVSDRFHLRFVRYGIRY